jgi:hypothetical protein
LKSKRKPNRRLSSLRKIRATTTNQNLSNRIATSPEMKQRKLKNREVGEIVEVEPSATKKEKRLNQSRIKTHGSTSSITWIAPSITML